MFGALPPVDLIPHYKCEVLLMCTKFLAQIGSQDHFTSCLFEPVNDVPTLLIQSAKFENTSNDFTPVWRTCTVFSQLSYRVFFSQRKDGYLPTL